MSALTTIFPQLFQSHAGSIEAGLASLPRVGIEPTFQSHAGSIEAKAGLTGCQSPPWFQSHAGSIEAFSSGGDICYAQPRFNPTLVRLRPVLLPHHRESPPCFNPTLVRLRRGDPPGRPPGARVLFQSHAGSIEASLEASRKEGPEDVSIPRWFD